MSSPYYPEGTQYDSRAPWNDLEEDFEEEGWPEFWDEVDQAYDRWKDEQLGF